MATVHPLIRVFCYLIIALFLSWGGPAHLGLALLLIGVLYFLQGGAGLQQVGRMLNRMRWLFLSILLIYFWLTPGLPLWSGAPAWFPSREGMASGLHRVAVLVLLVLAVQQLLASMSRHELIAAIYRLAWPLSLLGLSRERLAVRIVLVLERVSDSQALVNEAVSDVIKDYRTKGALITAASNLFMQASGHGEEPPSESVEIEIGERPPLWQWGLPIALALLMNAI